MSKLALKKESSVKAAKQLKPQQQQQKQAADLEELIAVEAYLLAEKRGFQGGDPVADWLEAESKLAQA